MRTKLRFDLKQMQPLQFIDFAADLHATHAQPLRQRSLGREALTLSIRKAGEAGVGGNSGWFELRTIPIDDFIINRKEAPAPAVLYHDG